MKTISEKTLFLILISFGTIIFKASSQNAEYTNFGIHFQYERMYTDNQTNAVNYNLPSQNAFTLGLNYRFTLHPKFNLDISANYRFYDLENTRTIKREDLGINTDIDGSLIVGPNSQIGINSIIKYHLLKNRFLVGLGPELIIYPDDPGSGSILQQPDNRGYTNVSNNNGLLYLGLNVSLEYVIPLNVLEITLYSYYHWQPKDLFTITVTTQNLLVSENTISQHSLTGNYLAFGIKFRPSKSIFN